MTDGPTTTVEVPPTQPATTTTSTTSTTSATAPPATVDPVVVAGIDALAAEAFVDYEATWLLTRAAFEDPSNAAIRDQLDAAFASESGAGLFDVLDEQVETGSISLPPDDGLF